MSTDERAFRAVLNEALAECTRLGYNPGYFRQMLATKNAFDAARQLIIDPIISAGVSNLLLIKRVHLSLEAIALRPEWQPAFNGEEKAAAAKKLLQLERPDLVPIEFGGTRAESVPSQVQAPAGRRWTRGELIPALSLYCRLPFGQLHASQPDIAAMAAGMERTPASVSMKLCNFASMDPELQARGIKGLEGASKLDHEVWDEFYGRWDLLADAVTEEQEAALMLSPASASKKAKNRPVLTPPMVTEGRASVKVRRGQAFFRQAVLAAYEGKCCITGITMPGLLRASHIVGWAMDEGHRLNPCNGLCLNVLHDSAFDGGLLTLDERLRLVLSKSLKDAMPKDVHSEWFVRYEGKSIAQAEKFGPDAALLKRHREDVFVA